MEELRKRAVRVSPSCGGFFARALCLLACAASTAGAQTISVTVNRGDNPTNPNRPIDGWLRTNGTLLTAMNLGSASNQTRGPGAGIPFTGITGGNPAGPNWFTVGASVDGNLGGFGAGIDPVFFSEIYGASPVTLTYSNLNPARAYEAQILHGEPRATAAGVFTNNQFTTRLAGGSAGPNALVPQFRIGNSIASENPPNSNDLALVTAQLSGITSFTYVMRSATNNTRGPSIAGFQVRALPLTHVVTTAADSGAGSLRQAIFNAVTGDVIVFANALSGQTILLTNGILFVNKNLTLDGSALANGMTLDGRGLAPILFVDAGAAVAVNSLTLTNGFSTSEGGAILNVGTLTLNRCTVTGNVASNSVAASGGGIVNGSTGTLTVNQSTITGNRVTGNNANGGGIYNLGVSAINQSTVAGNVANGEYGYGGGILNADGGTLSLRNSIVAGNSASYLGANIEGSFTALGTNLTAGDPLLAPLGNNDGPTPTMPPLPESPAIDRCENSVTNTFATDQRGLPRLSAARVDIGAVERVISAPTVNAQPATAVTLTSATLRGVVNPGEDTTVAYFEYGLDTNYGNFSPTITLAATNQPLALTNLLDNLEPNTVYHFRLAASNRAGLVQSPDRSFTTLRHPGIFTVTTTDDDGAGSLRQTILDSISGDTIIFATNLSGQTILLANGPLAVTNSLTIDASALAGGVIINGNASTTIFQVTRDTTAALISLTLTNGYAGSGGGIFNLGTLTLNQSTLSGNRADYTGGGIFNLGTLTLNQSSLSGNSAGVSGGGIYSKSTLTLNQSTLAVNRADDSGGGIYNDSTSLTLIVQSSLSGNSAGVWGGGICNKGRLTLNRSTLAVNRADDSGGGIYNEDGGELTLNQCTVFANVANGDMGDGGGIRNIGGGPLRLILINSIVAGNGASYLGANIEGSFTALGTNLTAGDPLLAPLGNYGGPTHTMPPLPGSPAIDRCTGGTGFTTDQRGFPRVSGAFADIGAVEAGPTDVHVDPVNVYVDHAITWICYVNVYDLPTNGGAFSFGAVWVNADTLSARFTNATLTLTPNTYYDQERPNDPYWWVGGPGGAPNKNMEANFYVENDALLAGRRVTFSGYCTSNTLASNYTSVAFIKDFFPGFSSPIVTTVPLVTGRPFHAELTTASGHHVQCGFATFGPVARTNNVANLGKVIINVNAPVVIATDPPVLTGLTRLSDGAFQFSFTNQAGASFTVLASTNLALAANTWSNLGPAAETRPGSGQFQFTDPQATNSTQRFYQVRSP